MPRVTSLHAGCTTFGPDCSCNTRRSYYAGMRMRDRQSGNALTISRLFFPRPGHVACVRIEDRHGERTVTTGYLDAYCDPLLAGEAVE